MGSKTRSVRSLMMGRGARREPVPLSQVGRGVKGEGGGLKSICHWYLGIASSWWSGQVQCPQTFDVNSRDDKAEALTHAETYFRETTPRHTVLVMGDAYSGRGRGLVCAKTTPFALDAPARSCRREDETSHIKRQRSPDAHSSQVRDRPFLPKWKPVTELYWHSC
jgi:hypothetical protein